MDNEQLIKYGINAEKGLHNCMGNVFFYKKILTMFLSDTSLERAKAAFEKWDRREMFSCIHELKGICGNAALTEMYELSTVLAEQLRSESCTKDEVAERFALFCTVYERALEGIKYVLAH